MLPAHFVWVGAALILFGAATYIRDIYRGAVRPNLVTWFLWAFAPLIAFCAQLAEGSAGAAVLTLAVGLGPAAVCIAGFRRGSLQITAFDLCCGGASFSALLAWALTRNGMAAILLSIMADALAATPTIIKAYRLPESESPLFFLLFMASAIITLLTVRDWQLETCAFAVYIFVLYTLLFSLTQRQRRPKRRHFVAYPREPVLRG